MVVRLQTAEGKIKEYKTIYASEGGDCGPQRYHTKCGLTWDYKPTPPRRMRSSGLRNILSGTTARLGTNGVYYLYCVRRYNKYMGRHFYVDLRNHGSVSILESNRRI
jgi:hypothetical protein